MTFHSKTQVQGPSQQVSVQTRGCLHQIKASSQIDLTQSLIKNIQPQEKHHEPLKFGDEIKYHGMLKSDIKDSWKCLYDSVYFQTLMAKSKIPLVHFDATPHGIFVLLKDIATEYIA
jgi:hypothetical protein